MHPGTQDILTHMEHYFGPVSEHAMVEKAASPTTSEALAIRLVQPTPERNFLTLFTTGLSDEAMIVPEGGEAYRYAELFLNLPADWPLSSEAMQEDKWYWPFDWLLRIAKYPRIANRWLGGPSTTITNGDPPEPLAENTHLSCLMLLQEPGEPGLISCRDGRQIILYHIVPIYEEERRLEEQQGFPELLQRFANHNISQVFDPTRVNVAIVDRI